jgi:hypothetical protein
MRRLYLAFSFIVFDKITYFFFKLKVYSTGHLASMLVSIPGKYVFEGHHAAVRKNAGTFLYPRCIPTLPLDDPPFGAKIVFTEMCGRKGMSS